MTRVIGIDPSLTETGVDNWHGALSIIPTKAGDPERLDRIYQAIRLLTGDLAVLEDLPTHAHGAGLTGMAQGAVRLALIHNGIPYITVTPATLKKFATGNGGAGKPDMRMELYKRTGIDVRNDNQVDAAWLRLLGHQLIGRPILDLPKTHTIAVDKIVVPDGFLASLTH